MPIYEYRCTSCSHDFSKLQKLSADAPPCPECGEVEVAKKVSHTSFQLKGGGWYVTDFREGGGGPGAAKKPDAPAESAPAAEKADKADAAGKADKADATPAAKTEARPAKAEPKVAPKKSPAPTSGSA